LNEDENLFIKTDIGLWDFKSNNFIYNASQ
jgi:hypothetical protein